MFSCHPAILSVVSSTPSIKILPDVGFNKPAIKSMNVDLPEPVFPQELFFHFC